MGTTTAHVFFELLFTFEGPPAAVRGAHVLGVGVELLGDGRVPLLNFFFG
jgi:hypothetical protein